VKKQRNQQIKKNLKHPDAKRGMGQTKSGNVTGWGQTPQEAHHAAGARAQTEYRPTERALGAEVRASGTRPQNTQAATETDASYNAANAAMQANIAAAAKAAEQSNAGVAGQNAEFAKLTGADPTAFAPSVQEGQAAAAQRSLTNVALSAPIAQAGASQAAYLRNTGINARHEGIYQQGQEIKRRLKIKQDLAAARKERSQKTEANYAETAENERNRNLERWKVNKAFPLEQASAALDARDTAHDNATADRNAATAERNAATTERNSRNSGGLTPSQQREARQDHKSAYTMAQSLYESAKKKPHSPQEWASWVVLVTQEAGVPASVAKAAVNRLKKKVNTQKSQPTTGEAVAGLVPPF
jgi:hypothetical protein